MQRCEIRRGVCFLTLVLATLALCAAYHSYSFLIVQYLRPSADRTESATTKSRSGNIMTIESGTMEGRPGNIRATESGTIEGGSGNIRATESGTLEGKSVNVRVTDSGTIEGRSGNIRATESGTIEGRSGNIRATEEEITNDTGRLGVKDLSVIARERLDRLGVLSAWNGSGWAPVLCDRHIALRQVSIHASVGTLTFYVYNSSYEDTSGTKRALQGRHFEEKEIGRFLRVSGELPLIDIGANLGLVTLQAAQQGRRVLAVEPIADNALRLCHSVQDFGHASLVHVVQNAVSSEEKNVTLAMTQPRGRTLYQVRQTGQTGGHGATSVVSIWLDRLLEVLPFHRAALKIDVEGHEGHVVAHADRLFQEIDIPLIWMEWKHVKSKEDYGGADIIQFMERHRMLPYNLMTGAKLHTAQFMKWPFSVLWRKEE